MDWINQLKVEIDNEKSLKQQAETNEEILKEKFDSEVEKVFKFFDSIYSEVVKVFGSNVNKTRVSNSYKINLEDRVFSAIATNVLSGNKQELHITFYKKSIIETREFDRIELSIDENGRLFWKSKNKTFEFENEEFNQSYAEKLVQEALSSK